MLKANVTRRDDLVVSYVKEGVGFIGTQKEALAREDVSKLIEVARWHRYILDLSGKWLTGDYSDLEFRYAKMDMVNTIKGTKFDRCIFNYVDLSNSFLFGNSFVGAIFKGVKIDDSNLSHADLSGAFLHRVSLNRTNMYGVRSDPKTRILESDLSGAYYL
jgi:uncharacterized protein YjbI with pentapeptide repeats